MKGLNKIYSVFYIVFALFVILLFVRGVILLSSYPTLNSFPSGTYVNILEVGWGKVIGLKSNGIDVEYIRCDNGLKDASSGFSYVIETASSCPVTQEPPKGILEVVFLG